MSELATPPLPRVVTDTLLGSKILDSYHQHVWPAGLVRFGAFTRDREKGRFIFRPVTWDASARSLYVLRIAAEAKPSPRGTGRWERWQIDAKDRPLDDVRLVSSEMVTPANLAELDKPILPSSLAGKNRRDAIVEAFCKVDIEIDGEKHRVFNPFVLSDAKERSEALRYIYQAMEQKPGYQTYILELFHKYVHNGGAVRGLARRTDLQGGPGESRVGTNKIRPGPKTRAESRAEMRTKMAGAAPIARRGSVRPSDIKKFVEALQEFYIEGKQTLKSTYASMLGKQYARYPRRLVPREEQFLYHCRARLLEKGDARRKRIGRRLAIQYATARTGQATRMTFGMNAEVVDVDGFVAKIPVAALIKGKIEDVYLTIIFAVSRRTGAVVGYEIAMEGEKSEAFRRCIASIYIPKEKRAKELGLKYWKHLVHGSIEAVFVDNGAGTADDVNAACTEMRLIQFYAPPQRGDLKSVGESLNNLMVQLLKDLVGGYTREKDFFAQELRKIKREDQPITVEQLETFLLMAIQHVNRFANKRHLRSEAMRQTKECSINPSSLWRWYQKRRVADQRVDLTPEEAWARFIPWQTATVRGGKVRFLCKRWTSDGLEQLYNEHMRKHGGKAGGANKPLNVEFKRVGTHATKLLWRSSDGRGGELHLTQEDAAMLGVMTWKELELRNADDAETADKDKTAEARSRSKLTLSSKQQKQTDKAEKNRAKPETVLEGSNIKEARKNARVRQDARRFADESTIAEASNTFSAVQAEVFEYGGAEVLMSTSDDAYDDDFAARLLAQLGEVPGGAHP
ncbi:MULTISPECIES: hypothetical protein [unclassified Paraburkholderia]|uniref:hypothetical protein n=1 Tax=unclassified Paraburkholderia TaxID=2615204 RepID=UPI002AB06E68|nr:MULTISPECIES: hypothetical protein [unclassified Paraburkholderia]